MKVAIAGCRNYTNYEEAEIFISSSIPPDTHITILSGGCRGADALGEQYAKKHGYDIVRFPALWNKYGRAAGIVRSKEIANTADVIICFWDGKSTGTKFLIEYANKLNKVIHIYPTAPDTDQQK